MKAGVKSIARGSLRRLATTRTGQRTLRWLSDQGLVPHEQPAPPATPIVEPCQHAVLEELWDRKVGLLPDPTFEDLTEQPEDDTVPPLDRGGADLTRCTADQRQWAEQGFVRKEGF